MKRKFTQITPIEKKKLIEDLNETNNMSEFLNLLMHRFNLTECKPGIITKNILSSQMVNTVLPMINPHER